MKTILIGVSGSISAYKSADLVRGFVKLGYNVHVLMTQSATEFITPLTLQTLSKNEVHLNVMNEPNPKVIQHIDLIKEADALILAPATANLIAKVANGLADDMVSTVALAAHDIPLYIAPAMNTYMYQHPATQRNLALIKTWGWQEIQPKESLLACGDYGKGALADVETILGIVHSNLSKRSL